MRLINTTTGRFHWVEDPCEVRYAILSHVWSKVPEKEQSYQDIQRYIEEATSGESVLDDPRLSSKVRSFCRVAREHEFELGWVDACCIDRTSSSELSEAITSMYDWYRHADVCFAYLHDVHVSDDANVGKRDQQFHGSRWFLRGWTLQELLAPSIVLFLSSTWDVIGSKQTCSTLVASITNIDRDVLTFRRSLEEISVASKMSWAASRSTTREEDEAYCLMGIFGVSIPIIYGEGRFAFVRLQEEVIKRLPDQSIFAWGRIHPKQPFQFGRPDDPAMASTPKPPPVPHPPTLDQYLLASSPRDFANSSQIVHLSRDEFAHRLDITPESTYQVFRFTAYGLHVQLPLIAIIIKDHHDIFPTHLALLACERGKDGSLLALLLRPRSENSGTGFLVGAVVGNLTQAGFLGSANLPDWHFRAVFLSVRDVNRIRQRRLFNMANLYIPHHPLRDVSEAEHNRLTFRSLQDAQNHAEVRLSRWSRTLLSFDGSRVLAPEGDPNILLQDRVLNANLAPGLVILHKGVQINIQIGPCNCTLDRRFPAVLGVLVWSPHAESTLEKRFFDSPHLIDHPVHFQSWSFHDGTASTTVDLRPSSSPREPISVRLSLCHDPAQSIHGRVAAYKLGIEVTTLEVDAGPLALRVGMRQRKSVRFQDPTPDRPQEVISTAPLRSVPYYLRIPAVLLLLFLFLRTGARSQSFLPPYTVNPSISLENHSPPTTSLPLTAVIPSAPSPHRGDITIQLLPESTSKNTSPPTEL